MDLPIENKRLIRLIETKSFGNKSEFAETIGVSATHINRMFHVDKRSKKYPSILKSPSVLKAIMEKYPEVTLDWFKDSKKVINGSVKKDNLEDLVAEKVFHKIKPYLEKIELLEAALTKFLVEQDIKVKKH